MQNEGKGSDLLQEPLVEDYEKWIEWRGCWVHTPDWWWELVGILGINDFQELAQKIRASFEIPPAKSKAQDVKKQLFSTTSPQVPLPEGIPATSKPNVPQPGL